MKRQHGMSLLAVLVLPLRVLSRTFRPRTDIADIEGMTSPSDEIQESYATIADTLGVEGARLMIARSRLPFAFATRKTVVISMRAVELLSPTEQRAILAHELSHIRHRDGKKKLAFSLLLRFLLPLVLSRRLGVETRIRAVGLWFAVNLISGVVLLSMSRQMERRADAVAVEVTDSEALSNALAKLKKDRENASPSDISRGGGRWWLQSHPPVEERME